MVRHPDSAETELIITVVCGVETMQIMNKLRMRIPVAPNSKTY